MKAIQWLVFVNFFLIAGMGCGGVESPLKPTEKAGSTPQTLPGPPAYPLLVWFIPDTVRVANEAGKAVFVESKEGNRYSGKIIIVEIMKRTETSIGGQLVVTNTVFVSINPSYIQKGEVRVEGKEVTVGNPKGVTQVLVSYTFGIRGWSLVGLQESSDQQGRFITTYTIRRAS